MSTTSSSTGTSGGGSTSVGAPARTTESSPPGGKPRRSAGRSAGGAGGGGKGLRYAVLLLLTFLFISPVVFMLLTSFKTRQESAQSPPTFWPHAPTFDAYRTILTADGTPVFRWFANSMIAATSNAFIVVITSALAAYALARMDFPGKKLVFGLIVATLFVPPVILVIPNYEIVGRLFWLDTLIAVIIPTAANAFGVFFMRQFFVGLPKELEESAYLDGANTWQVFSKVVVPLSRPALATLTLLAFLTNWNDFLWPVYVLFSPENQTLQAGLSTLQSANNVRYDLLMAGAVIASLPVLILYSLSQRFIIEGVSRSGLKG
jgi:multiple sugar transport system permease protein